MSRAVRIALIICLFTELAIIGYFIIINYKRFFRIDDILFFMVILLIAAGMLALTIRLYVRLLQNKPTFNSDLNLLDRELIFDKSDGVDKPKMRYKFINGFVGFINLIVAGVMINSIFYSEPDRFVSYHWFAQTRYIAGFIASSYISTYIVIGGIIRYIRTGSDL
ncbi:MAG: hypothetical protein KDC92_15660 [Bacteroidetes bacterium]|nr:hypothetical protein [Bacteroidota bacterium]